MKIQADVYLTTLGLPPMPKRNELSGWERDYVTDKQKYVLDKHGIAYARVKYKGQASKIIQVIYDRDSKGLPSPKQIQVLLKHGYEILEIQKMTRREASIVIAKFCFDDKDE